MQKLSVIIPAHNECDLLGETSQAVTRVLEGMDVEGCVILVDDGSSDASWMTIKQLAAADSRVRGVRLSRNFGKEAAIQAGLDRAADTDAVIVMDADLEHPPTLIPEMVAHWRRGALIVHAVKRRYETGIWRRLASAAFTRLNRSLSGVPLEGASDFKLLDRRVLKIYREELSERRRFFRGLTEWIGFPRAYIQFSTVPAAGRRSRWKLGSLVLLALTALTSFTSRPLHLTTFLGIVQLVMAIGLGAQTLWMKLSGQAVSGFTTVILLLLLTDAMILIALGIIGEYIKHIYDEVKQRPIYLIAESTTDRDGSPEARS